MVFLRKLKLIYPSSPQQYNNCSAPTFLILFKNIVSPTYIWKRGQTHERLQRRDNKVITILYDSFLIYRTVKLYHLKKIYPQYTPNISQKNTWYPKLPSYFWPKFTIKIWKKWHIHHKKKFLKRKGNSITPAKTNAPILQTSSERLKLTIQTYQMRNKELKNEAWTTSRGNIKSIFASQWWFT